MAKPIELETVFTGDAAIKFNKYINEPKKPLTPESRAVIQKAVRLAKEWP